jgi:hypothetical protein
MATCFGKTETGLALMFNRNDVTDIIFLAVNTRFEDGRPAPGLNGPCFYYEWPGVDLPV